MNWSISRCQTVNHDENRSSIPGISWKICWNSRDLIAVNACFCLTIHWRIFFSRTCWQERPACLLSRLVIVGCPGVRLLGISCFGPYILCFSRYLCILVVENCLAESVVSHLHCCPFWSLKLQQISWSSVCRFCVFRAVYSLVYLVVLKNSQTQFVANDGCLHFRERGILDSLVNSGNVGGCDADSEGKILLSDRRLVHASRSE